MTHVRYDLPTILYIMCCVNDLLTASLVLFVAVSFFNERDAQFFEDNTFCKCWALLSRINHRISVFLVMVLSISRTVSLTTPLRMVKRRFALVSIGVWVFLAILYEVVLTSKFQKISVSGIWDFKNFETFLNFFNKKSCKNFHKFKSASPLKTFSQVQDSTTRYTSDETRSVTWSLETQSTTQPSLKK